jgi:hypothetical protein
MWDNARNAFLGARDVGTANCLDGYWLKAIKAF